MGEANAYPELSADEAAATIQNNATVGFSGFTAAGSPKVIPAALAQRAEEFHRKGEVFQVRVLAGASTGNAVDNVLAEADAVSYRAPYQSSKSMRNLINQEKMDFVDFHLSHFPQVLKFGFLGNVDVAVVEATEVTRDGRVYLTTGIGASPALLEKAGKVLIEINRFHSPRLCEMIDIFTLPLPPHRSPIPIYHPLDRIGFPYATVDPSKVVGVVYTDIADDEESFNPAAPIHERIAENVVGFLHGEMEAGRIPKTFLPVQSGVGNVGNAVMEGLGKHPEIPPFYMYTEVFQNSCMELLKSGKIAGASTCGLVISKANLEEMYSNMNAFVDKIVLRPQELSNNPGLARRLGVIAMNTALEMDIYGNVNSSHVCGTSMMNGLGGSGDFERNAYLAIFMAPSYAKGGRISAVVPMCSHIDSSEHSVEVLVTEQGVADLRGLSPRARARSIIDNCAHPAYRDYLNHYVESASPGHIRHDLKRCFDLHRNLMEKGAMLPDLDMSIFDK